MPHWYPFVALSHLRSAGAEVDFPEDEWWVAYLARQQAHFSAVCESHVTTSISSYSFHFCHLLTRTHTHTQMWFFFSLRKPTSLSGSSCYCFVTYSLSHKCIFFFSLFYRANVIFFFLVFESHISIWIWRCRRRAHPTCSCCPCTRTYVPKLNYISSFLILEKKHKKTKNNAWHSIVCAEMARRSISLLIYKQKQKKKKKRNQENMRQP